MKSIKVLLTVLIVIIILASCKKNEPELQQVKFKFTLLDTLGNEKTIFNQGENIIFSFQIINESSKDLFLETFRPDNDFFKVYRLGSINEGGVSYGRPYEHLFCEYVGGFIVPQNDRFAIIIPWYDDSKYTTGYIGCPLKNFHGEVQELPIGKYYTEFYQSFKIGDIQTEEKHFEINFKIK